MERGQLLPSKHALTDSASNYVCSPRGNIVRCFSELFSQKQYVVLTLCCIEQNSPVAAIHRGASRESFSCGSVTSAVISGAVVSARKLVDFITGAVYCKRHKEIR